MSLFRSGVLSVLGALVLLLSLTVVVRAEPPSGQVCTDAACTITQSGPGNAACIQSGPSTSCTITQTGAGKHVARCIQRSNEPNASQTCIIKQTNTSDENRAEVRQLITQATCEPPPSTTTCRQDGLQTASIEQHNVSGDNFVDSDQNDRQRIGHQEGDEDDQDDQDRQDNQDNGSVHFASETEKATQGSIICQNRGTPSVVIFRCGLPDLPAASGRNFVELKQLLKQFAETDATATPQSAITQRQDHNQNGHVDQNSTGLNRNHADQRFTEKLKAPLGTTQHQGFDEFEFCCSEAGPGRAEWHIGQRADQQANPAANQFDATGGNCDLTSGNCVVDQRITQNGKTQTNHQSGLHVHTGFNCTNPPGPPTGCLPNGGGFID